MVAEKTGQLRLPGFGYEALLVRREGPNFYVDNFPEHIGISPHLFGVADPELLSAVVAISAANGEGSYRIVDYDGYALVCERVT